MLDLPDETRLSTRANLLAKVTIIAAGVVLLLGLVKAFLAVKPGLDSGLQTKWQLLQRFASTMSESGALPAAEMLIAAVLLIAAVRLAVSGAAPPWVPRHDETFTNRALLLARVTMIYAWIYLGYACIACVFWTIGSVRDSELLSGSDQQSVWLLRTATVGLSNSVIRVLSYFLTLVLGACLIRTLILLSARDTGVRQETKSLEAESNEQPR
jgi:hypothetical protein